MDSFVVEVTNEIIEKANYYSPWTWAIATALGESNFDNVTVNYKSISFFIDDKYYEFKCAPEVSKWQTDHYETPAKFLFDLIENTVSLIKE